MALQETHWQATAEFTASGWYCVSSASPDDTLKAKKSKKGRGGTAQTSNGLRAPVRTSQVLLWSGLTGSWSPCPPAYLLRASDGKALEVRFDWQGARVTVVAVYQHVWSPAKTVHNNRQDRASLLKALGRCIKRVPHGDTLILAGETAKVSGPCSHLVQMSRSSATFWVIIGSLHLIPGSPSLPTPLCKETSAPR